jgi:acyl-CoA dehydrogenase
MNAIVWIACAGAVVWSLAYFRINGFGWLAGIGLFVLAFDWLSAVNGIVTAFVWIAFLAVAAITFMPAFRRALISDRLLIWFRRVLPQVSRTEQEALDAGTVWWGMGEAVGHAAASFE